MVMLSAWFRIDAGAAGSGCVGVLTGATASSWNGQDSFWARASLVLLELLLDGRPQIGAVVAEVVADR